jgi:hypothetical protein
MFQPYMRALPRPKHIQSCQAQAQYSYKDLLTHAVPSKLAFFFVSINQLPFLLDLFKNLPVLSQVPRNLPQLAANSSIFKGGKLFRN